MKNIEGAFGQIGDAVNWKNGLLIETTEKKGFAIHGFEDQAAMQETAHHRGHIIKETAITHDNEWVYSI